jgi:hypothetical protein
MGVSGCDCPDCLAGKHPYALYRWKDGVWRLAGISLQCYATPEECQRQHWWGIQFEPGDVWEDGTPVVEPEPLTPKGRHSGGGGKVQLDLGALQKSAEALARHWQG